VPEEFASISSADTVLALGVGRRTQALRNVLGSAARSGAKVILVTGTIGAADRSVATVILRSRGSGPTLFDSSTATVSLLTYLCALLAARIGARAVERLHMIEAIHAEWGDSTDPET
jgi:DNA-binding MurR/RpiR family transcriptional regulator